MPYSFRIDRTRRLVEVAFVGYVPNRDLFQVIHDVIADPHFEPGFGHLVDMQKTTGIEATYRDMEKKAEADLLLVSKTGRCSIALVANSDLVFGMSRMYQALMEGSPFRVGTFRSLASARAWLEECADGTESALG